MDDTTEKLKKISQACHKGRSKKKPLNIELGSVEINAKGHCKTKVADDLKMRLKEAGFEQEPMEVLEFRMNAMIKS